MLLYHSSTLILVGWFILSGLRVSVSQRVIVSGPGGLRQSSSRRFLMYLCSFVSRQKPKSVRLKSGSLMSINNQKPKILPSRFITFDPASHFMFFLLLSQGSDPCQDQAAPELSHISRENPFPGFPCVLENLENS